MWQEQLRSNIGELDLHDLPSLPPSEKPPPAFSTLETGTMPPAISRSLSLPASDPEHVEELCHVSTYDLTTPELEGSVLVVDHPEKASVGGPGPHMSNGGPTEGEQRRTNLRIAAQDKVSRGFLSIPMDLHKS